MYCGKVQMSLSHLLWTVREMGPKGCAYLVFCGSRPSSQRVIAAWIMTPLCDTRRGWSQHDKCPVGHVAKFPNCRFQAQSWLSSFFFLFKCGPSLKHFEFKICLYWICYDIVLFYVLVSWPRSVWDLSSLIRDWTRTPCIGRQSLNHWPPGNSPQA